MLALSPLPLLSTDLAQEPTKLHSEDNKEDSNGNNPQLITQPILDTRLSLGPNSDSDFY